MVQQRLGLAISGIRTGEMGGSVPPAAKTRWKPRPYAGVFIVQAAMRRHRLTDDYSGFGIWKDWVEPPIDVHSPELSHANVMKE